MNQFFSVRRFSLLVGKHWADNKKRYLLAITGFIILLIVWFTFTMLVDGNKPMEEEMQLITFFFSLFGVGSFYASQYFRDLGSRAKGINFLLVPASAFEKILCSILYTVVLFFGVFLAAFYLVDVIMVAIANKFLVTNDPIQQTKVFNVFRAAIVPIDNHSRLNVVMIFFSLQSIFLLGSIYFSKYGFVKTVISGFVIFFLIFCVIFLLYEHLMPEGDYKSGFLTSYEITTNGPDNHLVQIPHWIGDILRFILLYALAPFFWIVSYYRLKEKQV
ncbi:hypothetical protein [Ferruginibacter sp.]